MRATLDVLVIDDDKPLRRTMRICLESSGCRVDEADSVPAARIAEERTHHDLVFLDLKLGVESGLDLLPALRSAGCEVVVLTGVGAIETAVAAIRGGARDYLSKPITPAKLRSIVEAVSAERRLAARRAEAKRAGEESPDLALHTRAPSMVRLIEQIGRVAALDEPILLRGEAGTGRRAVARRLHALGAHSSAPLVFERRATLARGTLYVDELSALEPADQTELLRLCQRAPSVRVIAASRFDLDKQVADGRLRPELVERMRRVEL